MSNLEKVNPSDVAETTALSQSGVANISKKLIAVMREVGYVQKAGHNDFQNYKYATEADAIKSIRPAMLKHGLCMIPSVESITQDEWGNTNVLMHYRIFDEEGNFLSFRAAGSGNDKNSKGVGDKGIYKALTGASKYALLKTFLMETGDDPEVPNEQEKPFKQAPVIPVPVIEDESEELSDTRVAFVMMIKEVADTCTTEAELTELWNGNRGELEKLKAKNKETHKELIAHFKTKKEELKANG
jgi:hypothetical protein